MQVFQFKRKNLGAYIFFKVKNKLCLGKYVLLLQQLITHSLSHPASLSPRLMQRFEDVDAVIVLKLHCSAVAEEKRELG